GSWLSNNSGIATITSGGMVTGISSGTVRISYTVINASGCSDSVSKLIVINAIPNVDFSILNNVVCYSASSYIDSSFVKLATPVQNGMTYLWLVNGVLIDEGYYFPKYQIQPNVDSLIVTLIAIGNGGCVSSSIVKTMNVNHKPMPAFSISDTIGCAPLKISLGNLTPDANNYSFSWDFGNGTTSTRIQPDPVSFNGSVNRLDTTYTIQLTAFNECDTIRIQKIVTVKSKALINYTVVPLNNCSPMMVVFQNKSIGLVNKYALNFGDETDTSFTSFNEINHIYTQGFERVYNSKLTGENVCGIDSLINPVKTFPNSVKVNIALKDSAVCGKPYTATIINQTTGANQIKWDFGDGKQLISSADSIQHNYSNPGKYLITAIISGICSDTIIYRNVYINDKPKANFKYNMLNGCIGDSLQFQNLTDTATAYTWNFGDGLTSTQINPVYSYHNAGNYAVQLLAILKNDIGFCMDSITKPVTIISTIPGKMNLPDTIIHCLPETITFVNRSVPVVQTLWRFSNGYMATGDSTNYTFTQNGVYQISMLATTAGGCKLVDTAIVTAIAPTGNINYKGGMYCKGSAVQFNIQFANTDSVKWTFGDGETLLSNGTTVYHTYNTEGYYLPKVELYGNFGCVVKLIASDTIKIDTVHADFKYDALFNCGITYLTFTDKSKSYLGLTNVNWKINDIAYQDKQQLTTSFTKEGTYPVTIMAQSIAGCVDTHTVAVPVKIFQYPKVNIQGMAEACQQTLINLESHEESMDSIVARMWNLNDSTISTDSIAAFQSFTAGIYPIQLTVSTVNKCLDSAYKFIAIHPAPVIAITNPANICLGSSAIIQAEGAMKYIWKDQDNNIINKEDSFIKVSPTSNTTYSLIGYNEFGCSQVQTTNLKVVQPFVMSATKGDSICIGTQIKLSANGATNYSWFPSNSLNSSTAAQVIAKPDATTTYTVIGRDNFNCFADTASMTVVVGKPGILQIGSDTIMQAGNIFTFKPVTTNPIVSWSWSGADGLSCYNCPSPTYKPGKEVCIKCSVTDVYGCVVADTLCIKTFCPNASVFLPNAFTPDGDGINDKLMVQGKGIQSVKSFRVFNRWGELVFEKTNFSPGDPAYGWDGTVRGKPAPPEVFVWVCEVYCYNGSLSVFKGNSAVIK
ncbi:PKD domain-containing protein, partial [Limnovirga soli]